MKRPRRGKRSGQDIDIELEGKNPSSFDQKKDGKMGSVEEGARRTEKDRLRTTQRGV